MPRSVSLTTASEKKGTTEGPEGMSSSSPGLDDEEWEHVKAEPTSSEVEPSPVATTEDSPHLPSHSPASPHPPSFSPPGRNQAEVIFEVQYKITIKSGERVHRENCTILKHHTRYSLVSGIRMCRTCLPAGVVSADHTVGFRFEHPSHLHHIGEDGQVRCIQHCDRILKPCRHCFNVF